MSDTRRQLSRFTAIFAGGTLISRVLGLVRDVIIGAYIPGISRDAFLFAFKLPNMLRDILGEGATNAAFIPVLSEAREKKSPEEFRELVRAMLSFIMIVLAVVTVLGTLAMPLLPHIMDLIRPITGAENKHPETLAFTIRLMQATFPYLFMIGLSAFAMAPLFTVRHYSTPSWSPALLNVMLIACCLLLYNRFPDPAWALVVGVWLGGLAQLVVMFRAMKRKVGVVLPSFRLRHPGVGKAVWLLLPVIVGQATGEVNKLVDNFFAYSLEEGVVSALFFANRLVQLPLSIFGIAVSVAILPAISQAAARKETAEFRETILHGLRQSYFLVFPAMAGLVILREPLVRVLFERGAFNPDDTTRTATALLYYGLGLLSFTWVKVTVSGFYGAQDTKTPVIIATASMFLNILLNCVFVGPFGYAGLAAATTISFTVNFVLLYLMLNVRFGRMWDPPFLWGMLRISVATLMMSAVTYGAYDQLTRFLREDMFAEQLMAVVVTIALAIGTYVGLCRALRIPDMDDLLGMFRRR
jgi:putative peptidoglycan lipid II flippase